MRIPELRRNGASPEEVGLIKGMLDFENILFREVTGDIRVSMVTFIDEHGDEWPDIPAIEKWILRYGSRIK